MQLIILFCDAGPKKTVEWDSLVRILQKSILVGFHSDFLKYCNQFCPKMILIFIIMVGIGYFYIKEILQRRRAPPGPWPLPLIGNLHQMAMAHSQPDIALAKLSEKYGEIYRIKVGGNETVILSSYEAIRQVLSNKEAMGRDVRGTFYDRNKGRNSGIALSEGPKWEKIRSWTIKNLRDYGFNKTSSMESSISDDIQTMFEKIDNMLSTEEEGVLDIGECFLVPVFKFTWKLLLGYCTLQDEEMLESLIHKSEKVAKSGMLGLGLINAFPFMRFLFPNWTGHNISMEFNNECYEVAQMLIREAQAGSVGSPRTFIEAYAQKMIEVGNDPTDYFNEHEFCILFTDLVQTGSDTTSSYLESLILYMVLYPEIQARVYKEIQRYVPQGETLVYAVSKSMVYTQAVMLEAHRHTKVVQNFIPRKVSSDIDYKGYTIKKGTVIISDLHTHYHNKSIWKDSDTFQPGRFIDTEGKLTNKEFVIPFNVGKRSCPADNLAEVSSFLFFASILRKYKLAPMPGQPLPRQEMCVGITSRPYPFKISISKRQ